MGLITRPLFSQVLISCIGEACAPQPRQLLGMTEQIRREGFPTAPLTDGWCQSWRIACVAVRGENLNPNAVRTLTEDIFMTYQISLSTGDANSLDVQVHASATEALGYYQEKTDAGLSVTIMGPNGQKLTVADLQALSDIEKDETSTSPGSAA